MEIYNTYDNYQIIIRYFPGSPFCQNIIITIYAELIFLFSKTSLNIKMDRKRTVKFAKMDLF